MYRNRNKTLVCSTIFFWTVSQIKLEARLNDWNYEIENKIGRKGIWTLIIHQSTRLSSSPIVRGTHTRTVESLTYNMDLIGCKLILNTPKHSVWAFWCELPAGVKEEFREHRWVSVESLLRKVSDPLQTDGLNTQSTHRLWTTSGIRVAVLPAWTHFTYFCTAATGAERGQNGLRRRSGEPISKTSSHSEAKRATGEEFVLKSSIRKLVNILDKNCKMSPKWSWSGLRYELFLFM